MIKEVEENSEADVNLELGGNSKIEVTSPNAVGGGRMERLATFGRGLFTTLGQPCCSSPIKKTPNLGPLPDEASARPTSPSSAGRGDRRRGGYVLVLVAMLLFGIMAMAALVIDIGFARLTQRQMQTATDAAAIEGLRGQGIVPYEARQASAESFIAWQFDDDLDTTNGDHGIAGLGGAFGAGPVVDFSGQVGDPSNFAGQLLTIDPNKSVYKPELQRGTETLSEFRVSLQRGGTLDSPANLFSQGPSIPYLFARGSLINRQQVGNGIAVRASSSAVPNPALKIGLPVFDASGVVFPGAIAIGYELADWNGSRNSPLVLDSPKTVVGQSVVINGSATTLVDGYCSVIADISGPRVIGFGWIDQGSPRAGANVAPGNAVSRLSEVWADIEPTVRQPVLTQNANLIDGLSVSTPRALR